jgi:hypothetical protein
MDYEIFMKQDWKFIPGQAFARAVWPPSKTKESYSEFFRRHTGAAKNYSLKTVPAHQKTMGAARKQCSMDMMRDPTIEKLEKRVKRINDEESKEAMRIWWDRSSRIVENEAHLTYWRNDLHLRWKPANEKKVLRNGKLHGSYEALLILENGEERVTEVAPDWVEANVEKEAIAIVHRVSEDLETINISRDQWGEKGFVSITKQDSENSTSAFLYEDKRQISMIRYLPPKTFVNSNEKEVTYPEKWKGIIKDGTKGGSTNMNAEIVTLDQGWMDANISKDMQAFAKSLREYGTRGFVRIPEGAPTKAERPCEPLPGAPSLKFLQEKSVQSIDRSCVLKGAASCLWFLGYKRIAYCLVNDLNHGYKMERGFEIFAKILHSTRLERRENQHFQYCSLKKNKIRAWDILVDSKEYMMCLVGVQSVDGKTDHAIAVAGDWIFDSNISHALPLTRESLDYCCSDSETESKYLKVTRACMLKRRGTSKNPIKRKRKRNEKDGEGNETWPGRSNTEHNIAKEHKDNWNSTS